MWLIDEADAGFYVLRAKDAKKAVFIPRNAIRVIYFGQGPEQPKTEQPQIPEKEQQKNAPTAKSDKAVEGERKDPKMKSVTLSDLAALLGMLLGTAGFIIGLMNYLRDRPIVKVFLKWDMTEVGPNQNLFGVLRVTNVGRRPIYISVAALQVPKGFTYTHLILKESMPGTKLSEGDAPATFMVNYDGLGQYAKHWRKVRGYVEDSAGHKYFSKKLPKSDVPSWAKENLN
jgi:hypothetical protein